MATYKTPGVYIQEVSNLPPSAVQVETALPAFVGYTAKTIYQGKSLVNKPTRIASLIEFVQLYGQGPQIKAMDVTVFSTKAAGSARGGRILDVKVSGQYLLFDALRTFYLNGGGDAYIVSIGAYQESGNIEQSKITDGLDALKEQDEPTMLVIPDLMLLKKASAAYSVQQQMLMQCGNMQNRVALLDIHGAEGVPPMAISSAKVKPVKNFRNKIGKNFLDFAAAYYPWLETTLSREINFNRIRMHTLEDGDASKEATPLPITEYLEHDEGVRKVTTHLSYWNAQVADTFQVAPKFYAGLEAIRTFRDGEDRSKAEADKAIKVVKEAKSMGGKATDDAIDAAIANLNEVDGILKNEKIDEATKVKLIDDVVDEAILSVEKAYAGTVMERVESYDSIQLQIDQLRSIEDDKRDAAVDALLSKLDELIAASSGKGRKEMLGAAKTSITAAKTAEEKKKFDAAKEAASAAVTASKMAEAAGVAEAINNIVFNDKEQDNKIGESKAAVETGLEAAMPTAQRKSLKAAEAALQKLQAEGVTAAELKAGKAEATQAVNESGDANAAAIEGKITAIVFDKAQRKASIDAALAELGKALDAVQKLEEAIAALERMKTQRVKRARDSKLQEALEKVRLTRNGLQLKRSEVKAHFSKLREAGSDSGKREKARKALIEVLNDGKAYGKRGEPINEKIDKLVNKLEEVGKLTDEAAIKQGLEESDSFAKEAFNLAESILARFYTEAQKEADKFLKVLEEVSAAYRNLKAGIMGKLNLIPPSGAMAGMYAYVDRNRGVWKAPANVSLTGVIRPNIKISDKEQENLNVDADSGKSVNAIREFKGKGTLVWGARTLLGNNNEWRYISVRRFFIMVEQSLKKGTQWAVFEPNDAKTWSLVRGMIKSFLAQQWKAGALAGSSPDQAFFVNLGLGSTMTAQDILEGRMIVEIGMAVVRPAEFIILRFSHKMQES